VSSIEERQVSTVLVVMTARDVEQAILEHARATLKHWRFKELLGERQWLESDGDGGYVIHFELKPAEKKT
jgi:hypothetical protein